MFIVLLYWKTYLVLFKPKKKQNKQEQEQKTNVEMCEPRLVIEQVQRVFCAVAQFKGHEAKEADEVVR